MKKYIILLLILCSQLWAGIEKLGPQLGLLTLYPQRAEGLQEQGLKKTASGWQVETIVEFDGDVAELAKLGHIRCVHKQWAILELSVDRLNDLASLDNVQYVQMSVADKPLLDKSTAYIGAVNAREQLGYTGKGVLIGIIDSGIDWTHQDFIDAEQNTRIKYLLDFSKDGSVYGGTLYTEDDINNALKGAGTVAQRDYSGHGTHVAGIAAGDGSDGAGFGKYCGVAPEADLIIVKATRDQLSSEFLTADQIIALHFIDSLATYLDMPYVVNMSLGGHWGAHNGTSSVERVIDGLVGPGKPGKAVVNVAGNDRDLNIHGQAVFSGSTTSKEITFNISPYSANLGNANDFVGLDIWYDGDQNVSVTVVTPEGRTIGPIRQGDVIEDQTDDGTVYVWNGFYEQQGGYVMGASPIIGSYEIYVEVSDENMTQPPAAGEWKLRFSGTEGNVDAWIANATMAVEFGTGAVDNGKISVPGTSKNAITVGAYVSKKTWTDLDGNYLSFDTTGLVKLEDIAYFSSPGPTRDGRVKPDLTAPGHIIESSYSIDAPPTSSSSIFYGADDELPNALISESGVQALSSGTSMAAPHVTGAVALIFEKYKDSTNVSTTATVIRDLLVNSATGSNLTGSLPNDDWGYGKMNVFTALQGSLGEDEDYDYILETYPNPFKESVNIVFELPVKTSTQYVEMAVYNILGQRVRNILDASRTAGPHQFVWDGRDDLGYRLASGVYFLKFKSGDFEKYHKMLLLN